MNLSYKKRFLKYCENLGQVFPEEKGQMAKTRCKDASKLLVSGSTIKTTKTTL